MVPTPGGARFGPVLAILGSIAPVTGIFIGVRSVS